LVRDILYPKVFKFGFYQDGLKFVGIMAVIAFLGTFYTTPKLISNEYADESQRTKTIISRTLNLFVIAIPPALPTAVGCGVAFAAARLRTLKIFTTSP
jgi:cation-transporting ATPase 13A3/4/5